jgi:hypothetical protein
MVMERFDKTMVSEGYAYDYLRSTLPNRPYDASERLVGF